MNLVVIYLLIAIMTLGYVNGQSDWGYRSGNFLNPAQWKNTYKSCGGNRQTPININNNNVEYWATLKPVSIMGQGQSSSVSFKKGDMTIYLSFSNAWNISFGGNECFRPSHIHWHWGSVDSQGSEHTLDGAMYPIEGHLVTFDCNLYTTIEEAIIAPSGLLVLGMLYQLGDKSLVLEKMANYFNIVKVNGSVTIPEISPREFLPNNLNRYYRYEGSLTTPPCTENVIWTVFNQIQTIDSTQLNLFRSLKYGSPETGNMVDNFRPVLPIIGSSAYVKRTIYASFNRGSTLIYRSMLLSVSAIITVFLSS